MGYSLTQNYDDVKVDVDIGHLGGDMNADPDEANSAGNKTKY